jgi:hypothetical protein
MSYIRANSEPRWEEDIGKGWYVYSSGDRIQYLPSEHKPFIEVVMRMLEQEGSLDDETLEDVHSALRERLWVNEDIEETIEEQKEVLDRLSDDSEAYD